MANISRVNGLRPVMHVDGSPWNGQVTKYFVSAADATAIFQGDLVKLAATSDALGVMGITKFVAGTDVAAVGVVVGFSINPLNLNSPQYRPASTAMYALVVDAPDTVYEIQADTAVGATNFNKNINVQDAGGSTVTGMSGETAQVSTVATTPTLPLKIRGASQKVDNDVTSAASKILVMINNQQLSGGTGTTGV